jgi:hypothetical protein
MEAPLFAIPPYPFEITYFAYPDSDFRIKLALTRLYYAKTTLQE